MASLFDIDLNIRNKLDEIYEQEDGELNDSDFEALNQLAAERKVKLESVALYIKECIVAAEALSAEAKKLAARAKTAQNKAERLKDYLSISLRNNGEKEFETERCKLTFRKSEKVILDDENIIPKKYFVKTIEFKANKTAIKEALKAGQKVRGAHISEEQNLQVK